MQEACTTGRPKEEHEIEREVSQLRRGIEKMEEVTMTILGKLSPILREEPSCPANSEKLSSSTCTPLGAELRALINKVNGVITTQEDILNKLEI